MVREAWPYFRAKPTSIEFTPWLLTGAGDVLPEYLEGWDPMTDVAIERVVRCDLAAIRQDSALDEHVPLALSVSWINNQSFMTESLCRLPLRDVHDIRVVLPAARLGGSISLKTTVAVASTDPTRPLGSAKWAGSVLASHEQNLVLEGNGPMLPIAEVDFAATTYPPDASWALQLPADLSLPVLGSVLLLVNTRDRELLSALSASQADTRQTAILQALEGQIGAFLIAQATERAADVESEDWSDQSVGALLLGYLNVAAKHHVLRYFKSDDPTTLTAAYEGAARSAGFGRRFV